MSVIDSCFSPIFGQSSRRDYSARKSYKPTFYHLFLLCFSLPFLFPQPPPVFELMQGLLDGRAADCSPDMRTRAIGKMLQAKKVAASAASQICGYLSSLEA